MRFVIVHPEMGIYIGSALGLAFWTKLDAVGQPAVFTFETEKAAADVLSEMMPDDDHSAFFFKPVTCTEDDQYATLSDLLEAELHDHVGDLAQPGTPHRPN